MKPRRVSSSPTRKEVISSLSPTMVSASAESEPQERASPTNNQYSGRARSSSATASSPFMVRQAERAQFTGLSPIEEMRLAQNELRAIAASQVTTEKTRVRSSFQKLVTVRDMIGKLKTSKAKVAVKPTTSMQSMGKERLELDMDELTPAEALDFVELASKKETRMYQKQQEFEESTIPFYIISPNGKFRLRWDILSVTFIAYNAISIPFQLSFGASTMAMDESVENLQHVMDAFFIADIAVNFVSAYEDGGRIVHKLQTIAVHYIRSWFLLDFVSSFPIYLIQGNYSRLPQLARFFRLFRLLRLVRMLTITRILNRLEYALLLRYAVSSIFKFCLLVCFTSHWISCFFFLISDGKPNGWVAVLGLEDNSLYDKYVTAFYWAIMSMTTVGYGDIHPCNTRERIFAIVAMIIGAWIFAYGVTNVVAVVSNLNASDSNFQLKMDELNDYMEARELPIQLRYEIREFFSNARMSMESKLSNETKILAELSALLRSKIAFAINDSVLNKMPFFVGADHNFLMELALSMRMVCFPPMEEVILEGEIGEEMFFIFRGVVEILKGGVQLGLLGQKQYFGEMAILNQNCLRTATVRTVCFCELRMLTREKFLIALAHYPSMKNRIAKIVEKRSRSKLPNVSTPEQQPTRMPSSPPTLEKMAATLAGTIDEKTVREISAPTIETTLNRISQLNTNFSTSLRTLTMETDLESIHSKVAAMIEQEDKLAQLMDDMETQMNEIRQLHASSQSLR